MGNNCCKTDQSTISGMQDSGKAMSGQKVKKNFHSGLKEEQDIDLKSQYFLEEDFYAQDQIKDTYNGLQKELVGNYDAYEDKEAQAQGIKRIKIKKNNSVYIGQLKGDLRSGRGTQIFSDGSTFIGFWKDNQIVYGKMNYANGDSYFGQWKANKAHGYGKYESNSNDINSHKGSYEGQWKYDMPEGKGTEIIKDIYNFEGSFTNGIKNGQGKLVWSKDLSQYDGEFFNNMINGKGRLVIKDVFTYEGEFKNNQLNGRGDLIWHDGQKYSGNFLNNKYDGYGTFFWTDGKKYEGQFTNGLQNGKGKLSDSKGNFKEGQWKEGTRQFWNE